jgi:hypothetical protein
MAAFCAETAEAAKTNDRAKRVFWELNMRAIE